MLLYDKSAAEGGKLIVGFDAEFPPFGYIAEDGSYDGFDLALAQEVCARLSWEYEAVAIDWASKDAELKAGNINCIWNGFTCTGREEEYTWSDAYIDNSIVAIVRADSGIESLADLAGKTVMVQSASSGLDALTANEELTASFGELVQLPDYNTGFLELRGKYHLQRQRLSRESPLSTYFSAMLIIVPSSAMASSCSFTASRSASLPR